MRAILQARDELIGHGKATRRRGVHEVLAEHSNLASGAGQLAVDESLRSGTTMRVPGRLGLLSREVPDYQARHSEVRQTIANKANGLALLVLAELEPDWVIGSLQSGNVAEVLDTAQRLKEARQLVERVYADDKAYVAWVD